MNSSKNKANLSLILITHQHSRKSTPLFKYQGIYVDRKLCFNKYGKKMLQKIYAIYTALKHLNRLRTALFIFCLFANNPLI